MISRMTVPCYVWWGVCSVSSQSLAMIFPFLTDRCIECALLSSWVRRTHRPHRWQESPFFKTMKKRGELFETSLLFFVLPTCYAFRSPSTWKFTESWTEIQVQLDSLSSSNVWCIAVCLAFRWCGGLLVPVTASAAMGLYDFPPRVSKITFYCWSLKPRMIFWWSS